MMPNFKYWALRFRLRTFWIRSWFRNTFGTGSFSDRCTSLYHHLIITYYCKPWRSTLKTKILDGFGRSFHKFFFIFSIFYVGGIFLSRDWGAIEKFWVNVWFMNDLFNSEYINALEDSFVNKYDQRRLQDVLTILARDVASLDLAIHAGEFEQSKQLLTRLYQIGLALLPFIDIEWIFLTADGILRSPIRYIFLYDRFELGFKSASIWWHMLVGSITGYYGELVTINDVVIYQEALLRTINGIIPHAISWQNLQVIQF